MFHPSLHLLAFVCGYRYTIRFEGGRLALGTTQCLLNTIIQSPWCFLLWRLSVYPGWAVSNTRLHIASLCVVPCSWQLWESLGDRLYSIRASRLASMTGLISLDLTSNQPWVFEVFFPKVARAVHGVSENFTLLYGRVFGAPNSPSKTSANCDMRFGCDILLTSIRGLPCFFVRWNLFGCSLILQHINEWSVLQSALW